MNNLKKSAIASALLLSMTNAQAAVELYNKDDMAFSADGFLNVFYSNVNVEPAGGEDYNQSRVKMGFLPNYIGFNFSKDMGETKIETRQSFWVSINDSDTTRTNDAADLGTDSLIDIRQFYAKVSGDWGSVLLGKDFGLFNRTNIFADELLLGYGHSLFGLENGGNVSFGNIGTGYAYPMPKAQITYTTPDMNGFMLSVGVMDPNRVDATSYNETPRLEFEAVYSGENFKVWANGMSNQSENMEGTNDSTGIGYGANFALGGFSLTASGYSAEGVGTVAGLDQIVVPEANESEGYLVQASFTQDKNRFVLSYGETENTDTATDRTGDITSTTLSYFRTLESGVIMVFDYTDSEDEWLAPRETSGFAVGAVVTF